MKRALLLGAVLLIALAAASPVDAVMVAVTKMCVPCGANGVLVCQANFGEPCIEYANLPHCTNQQAAQYCPGWSQLFGP